MPDPSTYLLFVAASAAIIIVPGPTVTVIVANSLRAGAGAGLLNVAGTQAGLLTMIAVLAAGFETIVGSMATAFELIRLLGAAYLIWLGVKLWRADGALADPPRHGRRLSGRGYFWQGFVVIWSNPKALLFFGAFLPQFIDPGAATWPQFLLLGVTFMVVGALLDGAYAVAAGRVGSLLSRRRVRLLERISGSCLIGGGLWLAFDRPD